MESFEKKLPEQDDKEVLKSSAVEEGNNEARKERIDKLQKELETILLDIEGDFGSSRRKWPEKLRETVEEEEEELERAKNLTEEVEGKDDEETRKELVEDYVRKLKEL